MLIIFCIFSALALLEEAECGILKEEISGLTPPLSTLNANGYNYASGSAIVPQNSPALVLQQSGSSSSSVQDVSGQQVLASHQSPAIGIPSVQLISGPGGQILLNSGSRGLLLSNGGITNLATIGALNGLSNIGGLNGALLTANGLNGGLLAANGINGAGLVINGANGATLIAPGINTNTNTYSQQIRQFAVPVPQAVPVYTNNPVPVRVPVAQPVAVNRPVRVEVPQPINVIVPKPYPVTVAKPVPVEVKTPVYVKVPHPVPVNVPRPVPVVSQVNVPVAVPQPIEVNVPVPIRYININRYPGAPVNLGGSLAASYGPLALSSALGGSIPLSAGLSASAIGAGGKSILLQGRLNGGLSDYLSGGISSGSTIIKSYSGSGAYSDYHH